jgi:hypothetical protein
MHTPKTKPVPSAILLIALGSFALSPCLLAQETTSQNGSSPAATPAPAQTGANPTGGWRRVGDPPNTPPASAQSQNAQSQNGPYYAPEGPTAGASGSADPQYQPPPPPPPPDQNQPVNDGNQPPPPPQYGSQGYPGPETGGQPPPYGRPPMASQSPYGGQQGYGMRPPSGPVPAQVTLRAGTLVTVRVNQPLSSDRNQPGDAFTATLESPLVADGVVVAEPGQTLAGRVSVAEKANHGKTVSRLGLELTDLTLVDGQQIPLQSQFVARTGPKPVGRDVAGAGVATGAGALIGAAAGGGIGAGIGAGAGLVAGIAGVMLTRGQPTVIVPEQELTFRIQTPVQISTANAPQAFHFVEPNDYASGPGPGYGAGYGGGYGQPPQYATAPAPYPYGYAYGYPYGYPYPYYYGYYPGYYPFGFGIGIYGGGFYRGYYGHGYYGGIYRGGYAGGGYRGGFSGGGAIRGGGGSHSGGHR